MEPDTEEVYRVRVRVSEGISEGNILINQADISSDTEDSDSENDSDSASTEVVIRTASAQLRKTILYNAPVHVLDYVTVELSIENTGEAGLSPRIRDVLPEGLSYVENSLSATQGEAAICRAHMKFSG